MFCQQNKAISEFEKEMLRPVFDVERWFTFREACLRRGNKFVMPKQYIKTAGCKTFAMYCRPGRTNELVIIPIPDDLKKTHLIVSKLQKSKVDFSIQVLDSQNKLLVPPHIFDLTKQNLGYGLRAI